MGMYTELIFGASLKPDTPELVIDSLKYMMETGPKPVGFLFSEIDGFSHYDWLFQRSSYLFGVCKPVSKMWFDNIGKNWRLSVRCNIKNYNKEIEQFLNWIEPHIESGSGNRNMYAIVIYEEQNEPTIYYLE